MSYLSIKDVILVSEEIINSDRVKKFAPQVVIYIESAGKLMGYTISKYANLPLYSISTVRSGNNVKKKLKMIFNFLPWQVSHYLRKLELSSSIHKRVKNRKVEVRSNLPCDKNIRILLVDDAIDTGISMKIAYEYLKDQGYKNIFTAVITTTSATPLFVADYSHYFNKVITFPWSIGSKEYNKYIKYFEYNERKKIAAFFDFDLTITNYDSFLAYLKFLYLDHFEFYIYLPYLFFILLLKKIKFIDLYKAKSLSLIGLKNKSKYEINEIANEYFQNYSFDLINKKAVENIIQHRKEGHLVFIITSAPNLYFDCIKENLPVTEIFANELEYINGKFTGKFVGEDCFGENKKKIIYRIADKYKIDLFKSFSYADHHSDIPMLSIVGNPIVINPTPFLKDFAENKNWKIEKWRKNY